MFIDKGIGGFSKQQAITGTSDVISNVYDAGAAKSVFGGSPNGPNVRVLVTVSASGGTSPTFRARLVGADNAALTSNPIIIADSGASRVLVAADIPLVVPLTPGNQLDAKRYYGVIYTQAGTSPTATVNADAVIDGQDNLLK